MPKRRLFIYLCRASVYTVRLPWPLCRPLCPRVEVCHNYLYMTRALHDDLGRGHALFELLVRQNDGAAEVELILGGHALAQYGALLDPRPAPHLAVPPHDRRVHVRVVLNLQQPDPDGLTSTKRAPEHTGEKQNYGQTSFPYSRAYSQQKEDIPTRLSRTRKNEIEA